MPDYMALARRFGGQTLRQGTASVNVTDPNVTSHEGTFPGDVPAPGNDPVINKPPATTPPPIVDDQEKQPPPAAPGNGSGVPPPTAADAKGYSLGDYTYAGFDPSSLTRNVGTTDPAAGAKDWVHRYLVGNQINPNSKSWAPDAATALNKQYNTNVFRAIDGETLGWGDEYAHSAPNGYGLQRGQYDPNAKGQFFWGSTTPRDDQLPSANLGSIGRMSLGDARSRLTAAAQAGYGAGVNPTDDQLRQYAEHYGFKTPAGATDTDASIVGQLEQKLRGKTDEGYWRSQMGAGAASTPPPSTSVSSPNPIASGAMTSLSNIGQPAPVNGSDGGEPMVMLRAPDGTTKQVPASQQAHYVGLGATVVGGA